MNYALLVGEMLIDFIPSSVRPDGALVYQPHPGGAVANAAVALARLGGAARFVGKLGTDSFGRLLLHVLQENKVDTRFVSTTVRHNTTLVLVTLQEQGQREFVFYRHGTADTQLEAGELAQRAWEDVVICHAGSVLLASEPARSATLAALDQARRLGLATSFDVNARPVLWNTAAELRTLLAQAVELVDLLKFSAEEAHYLDATRSEPFDPADTESLLTFAESLLARGISLVIITRGSLGTLLINRHSRIEVPALAVRALDTTGAGDAFMGAALYQLLAHDRCTPQFLAALAPEDLLALGRFANHAAALSSTRYGGIASLPVLSEIEVL
ncbi:MAG TPA: carbohydrate kinase [Ktedonobacteraceae bacterium]